jgi:flagellar biosynthesis protein FlhG
MILNEKSATRILPIASGKGGVGKTLVSSNLALRLAANGFNTVAVDLDLGGSNLHSYLGLKNTNMGIGNMLSDTKLKFEELIVDTPYENLRFIPGDVLVSGASNIQPAHRREIVGAIEKIRADYVVVDLGSGANFNVVDFFLLSNSGFVVTAPQAPAVVNAYGLLKNMTFRALQQTFTGNTKISSYLTRVLKEKRPGTSISVRDIVKDIEEKDSRAGKKARQTLDTLQPKIIVNMARTTEDLAIIENLRDLAQKNLQVNLECLGLIAFDARVSESVSNLEPFTEAHPESVVSRQIERIAQKVLQSEKFPYMPLDLEAYKDTYELTQIEAENDFMDMEQEAETASGEASLETTELIELISEQKKQIRELRGAVRMLTLRQQ